MKSRLLSIASFICASSCALGLAAQPSVAAEPSTTPAKNTKASFAPSLQSAPPAGERAAGADMLVFTSPPRESLSEGQAIYVPVAQYLSKAIGKKVVYRHPGTWGAYRSEMLRGDYDIIFDGPHFISYRAEKLQHQALAKLPGRLDFAIVTRANDKFESIAQMGGRTFCAHPPPNLGTLMLLSQFNNPARQPAIIPTEGWENIYAGLIAGRCAGAVLPIANLQKLDKNGQLKIVFKSQPLPNQGFSAGPRVTPAEQTKITAALISPEATVPLAKLRTAFKVSEQLTAASNSEYAGIGQVLRNEFGYY